MQSPRTPVSFNFINLVKTHPLSVNGFIHYYFGKKRVKEPSITTDKLCELLEKTDVNDLEGWIISYLATQDIYMNCHYDVKKTGNETRVRYFASVWINGLELKGKYFNDRKHALIVGFKNSVSFLETRMKIKFYVSERYQDDQYDTVPIRINFDLLNEVLNEKYAQTGLIG